MKRHIVLFIALFFSVCANAQLEVKQDSFKEVLGFVNINLDIQSDDNDVPYAVVKVKTENINDKQRRELLFQGDAATFIECEYKVGEVWVYLTYKATYLKISHPDYSSTEFWFPFDMEPKKGYELTLINKFNYNPAPEKPQNNYLIVKTDQQNAMIYFDDSFVGMKECSKLYKVGEKHKWRIECDLFYTETGDIDIVSGDPIVVEKTLRPSYGYINVKSSPENGAIVFIDGIQVGTTPYKSDRLRSGQHNVRIVKEMFNTVEQTTFVEDGKTTNVELKMTAHYSSVKVITDSNSDIFVDNEYKGIGTWSGRLTEGEHVFEARRSSHKTSVIHTRLILGNNDNIVIPNPEPIYGTLDINTTPMGATIYIDGKNIGTTPRILNNILIGQHDVKLEKNGYKSITKSVIVKEESTVNMSEKLQINNYTGKNNRPTNSKYKTTRKKFNSNNTVIDKHGYAILQLQADAKKSMYVGVSAGYVNTVAWYFDSMYAFDFSSIEVLTGLSFRIQNPFSLRAGIGYKFSNYADDNGDIVDDSRGIFSIGCIYRYRNYMFSFDYIPDKYNEFKIGFGWVIID